MSGTPLAVSQLKFLLRIWPDLVYAVHLATFLSLLIPSLSDSKSLTSSSFIAVWILSSLFTAVIAGRWKYAALIAAGISGGYVFSQLPFTSLLWFLQFYLGSLSLRDHSPIASHPNCTGRSVLSSTHHPYVTPLPSLPTHLC